MSKNKETAKNKKIIIAIVAVLLIAIFSFVFRDYFNLMPFIGNYNFDGPSNVFVGKSNQLYLIDNAKKKLIITNSDLEYTKEIRGGSLKDDFFYASLVCDDEAGNIYVADVVYSGQCTKISEERIIRFNSKGVYIDTIYNKVYEDDNAPFQYGNILEMKEENGILSFVISENGKIGQYLLNLSSNELKEKYWITDSDISDVSYDASQNRMIICTRQGNVIALSENGECATLYEGNGNEIPWNVNVNDNGDIYFTEVKANCIYRLQGDKAENILESDFSCYTVSMNSSGVLATTDYAGVWYENNSEKTYIESFKINNVLFRCIIWILSIAACIILVVLLCVFISKLIKSIKDQEKAIRIIMILVATVLCSVTISLMMIQRLSERQENTVLQELRYVGAMMSDQIDPEKVESITAIADYKNDVYNEIKEPLDKIIDNGYELGTYYYYVMYTPDGESFNGLLDYEESLPIAYPVYEIGDNVYTECFNDKTEKVVPGETSAYGTWTFVLEPIINDSGEVVAIFEVGCNLDEVEREKAEFFKEMLYTTGIAVIVIIMLLMEFLFALSDRKKARENPTNPSLFAPLRTTIFLIYLANSLQGPFVVQLCNKIYDDSLPISRGTAVSLPISAELFMAAVFSVIAGRVVGKLGTKKTLIIGSVIGVIGYLSCGIWDGYYMLLLGKSLAGISMGIIYVAANTLASCGSSEEERGIAFAGISAGVLSGITVGDGLGSLILSVASYKIVYIIAGIIMLRCFAVMLKSRDMKEEAEKEEASIKLSKFLFNPRVLPFFALILFPFMVMLSYREYFFPMYAEENGMSEVSIGRLFLLCGLIVIYLGPIIGEFLINKLGSKKTVILATAMMFANVLLFILVPGFKTAILGVLILSINISFAYTAQYAYFSSVPECDSYGEGNAMGIYSMIENLGQTAGPFLFAGALALGYHTGITIIGTIFGALLLLFLMVSLLERRKKTS